MTILATRAFRRACLVSVVSCLGPAAASLPPQQLRMATYTVSIPRGWWFDKNQSLDRVQTCNIPSGKCTARIGAFPSAGAVFLTLMPADNSPGHLRYNNIYDIVSSVPHAGMPPPELSRVPLSGDRGRKQCQVARSLLVDMVWDETYGLSVDGRLFIAWVRYNADPKRDEFYRTAVVGILSSVTLDAAK